MFKLPLTVALLAATVAAPAFAAEKTSFTHDGVTYSYTQEKVAGSTILKGTSDAGESFRYVIRNGRVTGDNNGVAVRFSVEDATSDINMTLVAAR